ncbi:MAG: hypothetical protein ACO1RX_04220 [Candidatus Sericytochromatia bacterium]
MHSDDESNEIVRQLIKLEVLTQPQLTEAIEYQCRLPQSQRQDLVSILLDMEYLTPEQLAWVEDMHSSHTPPQPEPAPLSETEQLTPWELLEQRDSSQTMKMSPEFAALFAESPAPEPASTQNSETDLWKMLESTPAAMNQPPVVQPPPATPPAPLLAQSPHGIPQSITPPPSGFQAAGPFAQRNRQPQTAPGVVATRGGEDIPPPPGTDIAVARARQPLGEMLIAAHELEEWQLTHALCVQRDTQPTPRLGTLLVHLGYVKAEVVKRALNAQ